MNIRRFYCDFANSRDCDIADILNMFKFYRDVVMTFSAEKNAPKFAVNLARVNGPLLLQNFLKWSI